MNITPKYVLAGLAVPFLFSGCSARWPTDLQPGMQIELMTTRAEQFLRTTVIRIDGEWLVVDYHDKPLHLPREQVTAIRILAGKP